MSKKNMIEHFSIIRDPRVNRTRKHKLIDILVIAVCGFLCKCETWVDIEEYGLSNIDWLTKILKLENGIPSHDTFGRVFQKIDPIFFNKAFYAWVKDHFEINDGEVIAIDGKYFRATASDGNSIPRPRDTLGSVNAWATKAGVALAQKRADFQNCSEIKVFRELIGIIDVKNCTVTMDAAGCNSETLNAVVDKGGDYCVTLKKNQKIIYRESSDLFDRNKDNIDFFETSNKGHDREENRKYESLNIDDDFKVLLEKRAQRKGTGHIKKIKSITRVTSIRKSRYKSSSQERYYLSSLNANAEELASIIRSHWHIENKLHWTLDVAFNEDKSTVRRGNGSENMSLLRKFCLNLIKKETSSKRSVNGKRLKCCWQKEYLLKVIYGTVLEI